MRIAAITSGRSTPSARYRVRQYVEPLRELGIHVHEFVPRIEKYSAPSPALRQRLKSWGLDPKNTWVRAKKASRLPGLVGSYLCQATWLERVLLPKQLTWELQFRRPLVFDFDDAIWMHEADDGIARRIVESSAHVVVGNRYLYDWALQHNSRVTIIPTSVDTQRLRPAPTTALAPRKPILGWIGTSSNIPYLLRIEKAIARVLAAIPDAELVVVSDMPPVFKALPQSQVRFVQWYPDAAELELPGWSVGLMPLEDSEWVRGKCGLKMLQYMAAGLPVCVSPYGMNRELLDLARVGFGCTTLRDWEERTLEILGDEALQRELGQKGRAVVEQCYSLDRCVAAYAKVFRSLGSA